MGDVDQAGPKETRLLLSSKDKSVMWPYLTSDTGNEVQKEEEMSTVANSSSL